MISYEELLAQEEISQTAISPGVISDEEVVSRVLLSPKHYDGEEVVPAAFDPAIFNGLSVLRKNYDFENGLKMTISLLETDEAKYCGYVSANVVDIRSIKVNGKRLYYLLDTSKPDRIGHADIHPIRLPQELDLDRKTLNNYIRYELSQVFNEDYIVA